MAATMTGGGGSSPKPFPFIPHRYLIRSHERNFPSLHLRSPFTEPILKGLHP